MDDLEQKLEASLAGKFVPKYALPSELQLNSVHAMLDRVAREQKRFALTEVKPDGHRQD